MSQAFGSQKRKRSFDVFSQGGKRVKVQYLTKVPRPVSASAKRVPRIVRIPRVGLQSTVRTKLRYTERLTLNPGAAGVIAEQIYRANSLYDPNYTGSGHQPMGFDQIMLQYTNFVVLGSTITVEYVGNQSTANSQQNSIVGINLTKSTSTLTGTWNGQIEQSTCQGHTNMGNQNFVGRSFVRGRMDTRKFFNTTDPSSSDDLIGSASADCTDAAYYQVWAQVEDAATDVGILTVLVTIEYDALFMEPKDVAAS